MSAINVDELPLIGLADPDWSTMSPDEIRAFIERLRLNRLSPQTMRATLAREAGEREQRPTAKVSKAVEEFI